VPFATVRIRAPRAYFGAEEIHMLGLIRRGRKEEESLTSGEEPNPAVALAVGLLYVFRTAAGARMMRELETAVRKYAADPQALWKLVCEGDRRREHDSTREVIDTTVVETRSLPRSTP
jgi:hypothetical protein